ncbi:hypothetical protein [Dapis sp. BLCC M229]
MTTQYLNVFSSKHLSDLILKSKKIEEKIDFSPSQFLVITTF